MLWIQVGTLNILYDSFCLAIRLRVLYTLYECARNTWLSPMVSIFYSSMLASSCANHVTSVMWLWVGVPLLSMSRAVAEYAPHL